MASGGASSGVQAIDPREALSMPRRFQLRLVVPAAAIAALAVAGCGGGGSSDSGTTGSQSSGSSPAKTTSSTSSSSSSSSSSSGGGSTVKLSADPQQLKFDVSTLKAKAGKVTLVMKNPANFPHAIAVEGHGVDKDGNTVGNGGTSKVTVTL